MPKQSVSLAIIALNEENNIERCIRSAPFVNEIVVLDSGSQDRTVEIAKSLGARVIVEEWRGFARQKMRATELAAHDWVLSLDADEALSPELTSEIEALLQTGLEGDGYFMARRNWYLGRWMKHSGMYPDFQTRLFDRRKAKWKDTIVHEHIVANQKIRLRGDLLHWSFTDISHQVATINRYSGLRAQEFKASGKRFSAFQLLSKTVSKFVQTFIFKQGFRDGYAGLAAATMAAFATALRWIKLYEIERRAD